MTQQRAVTSAKATSTTSRAGDVLHKCTCDSESPVGGGECSECRRKRLVGERPPLVQTKLADEPWAASPRDAMPDKRFGYKFGGLRIHNGVYTTRPPQAAPGGPAFTPVVGDNWNLADQERAQAIHQALLGEMPALPAASTVRAPAASQTARHARVDAEEARAQRAVARLAASPAAVGELARRLGDRPLPDKVVRRDVIETLEPHTGPLPPDLMVRTGSDVDRILDTGMPVDWRQTMRSGWEGRTCADAGGFAHVLVHEAAHVASGASLAVDPPHFDFNEPLIGSWYETESARQAELEAAETGEGRERTLARLAEMSDAEARREAPGIAYRAQDRNDIELAVAAAQRLLNAWLASSDHPATLTAGFGPEDAVDVLLPRADQALSAGHLELGGIFLSISMVQLVRAARATVLRRGPMGEEPGLDIIRQATLPMQRGFETDILQRIQRARGLLESHGRTVLE